MKLRNTKTELDVRKQLERSRAQFDDPEGSRIMDALRTVRPGLKSACVLRWTPDQGEEFFLVLADGEFIFNVEVDRVDMTAQPNVKEIAMTDYLRGLGRMERLTLAVAQDLCKAKL